MTDDDVRDLLVHHRGPPPAGYVIVYPVNNLLRSPLSPNSLQNLAFKIVADYVFQFVQNQRYPDSHFNDICAAKNTLVETLGFPPVVAYYVLPPLDYRSCCSCLSYVNQTHEDSDHESDDDESEDNADQVLQSTTQNQLHLNVPTEESWDSD